MRWLKWTVGFAVVTLLLLTTLFYFRHTIVTRIANHYLNPYQVSLSCLSVDIDKHLNVMLNTLCFNHPAASGTLQQVNIDWQLVSWSWLNEPEIAIQSINADDLTLQAASELLQNHSDAPPVSPLTTLHSSLALLARFPIPVPVNIRHFAVAADTQHYLGKLALSQQSLAATLWSTTTPNHAVNEQKPLLSISISRQLDSLSGHIETDLQALQQAFLPTPLPLAANWQLLALKGGLKLDFSWQANQLSAKLNVAEGETWLQNPPLAQTQVTFSPTWQLDIDEQQIHLELGTQTQFVVSFDDQMLLSYLQQWHLPPELVTLLQTNPLHGVTVSPAGEAKLDLTKQVFSLQNLAIQSLAVHNPSGKPSMQLMLSQVHSEYAAAKLKTQFSAKTQLNAHSLHTALQTPVAVELTGAAEVAGPLWQLELQAPSTVSVPSFTPTNDMPLQLGAVQLHASGNIKQSAKALALNLQLQGDLASFTLPKKLQLEQLQAQAKISGNLAKLTVVGNLKASKTTLAQFDLSGTPNQFDYRLNGDALAVKTLLGFNRDPNLKLKLHAGLLDYAISGKRFAWQYPLAHQADVSLTLSGIDGKVADFGWQDLNYQQHFNYSDGNLISSQGINNLSVATLIPDMGVQTLRASSNLSWIQSALKFDLQQLTAEAFGGRVKVPALSWPIVEAQTMRLELDQIDLEPLLALDKSKGIVVTGKISGKLPVTVALAKNGKPQFSIQQGRLFNVSEGIIRVKDNPAVANLKQQQSNLKLAFEALENLNYHSLTAGVSMANNGDMVLATAIQGHNPDIDNDVNFNLNLSYDLPGLLQSLMIANDLEHSLTNKLKPKEPK
ncbi:YdbH domain-containing protein [Pseudoalteromonas fenneropenaei]|uniref:YdbH domain-containing protein n=1 Tax=Pseudoalteromonas fenneropenaei TaxID=1737459 RepID=A0ABV7CCD6_9GAMM